ncbi:MAG: hypothetical protein N3F05_00525 [Candidatus Diapherotrites archaeon]|nr:hypothetical protein [Candidatus Diapherotrites archaeon]
MDEKVKRLLAVFSFVFVAYSSLAIYLIFFAPGLKFEIINEKLYLKNESSHVIKNITVETDSGLIIDCIPVLAPYQKTRIYVPSDRKIGFVIAKAPFHKEAKQYAFAESPEAMLSIEVDQENAKVGSKFKIYLNICNKTSEDIFITVSETHDATFIKEENKTILFDVKAGGCRKTAFEYLPIKSGNTEIIFIVTGEFFKKEIAKKIGIEA